MGDLAMPLSYYLDLTLSDDKLTAYLQFMNCDDKFAVTKEQLDELIKSHHIVYGIDEDKLLAIVRDPKSFFLYENRDCNRSTPGTWTGRSNTFIVRFGRSIQASAGNGRRQS